MLLRFIFAFSYDFHFAMPVSHSFYLLTLDALHYFTTYTIMRARQKIARGAMRDALCRLLLLITRALCLCRSVDY